MANSNNSNSNGRGGRIQRPNDQTQAKICQYKLVLLGESAVGKSSLVLRFVRGQFHEYQESTIGGECQSSHSISFSMPTKNRFTMYLSLLFG